ncbi:MAG TPA: methylated-DNA--[protein]-cysteine S-methyltransferase [Terriglobales bacterium]|nr:methylated-DNA--[protein]-cysteine S-methyltransferase [Terriglobales bacterium]
MRFSSYDSPIGHLLLVASDQGVREISFDYNRARLAAARGRKDGIESDEALLQCRAELDAYFAGTLREFTVPLDLRGTDFQMRCWRALLEIPYGETCSYADLARKVGSPRGFRAVGMANHDNPIPIIVPCHRVITSDRKLGGYGGGLDVKEKLLRLEGARWREPHPTLAFAAQP